MKEFKTHEEVLEQLKKNPPELPDWMVALVCCLNCGFKSGKRNGQEVIFAHACGLREEK